MTLGAGTRSWIRIGVIAFALVLVAMALFTVVVFTSFVVGRVGDWGMAPELNAGDLVFGFRSRDPHPQFGDLVLYVAPMRHAYVLTGRVAGVPGDNVVITGGRLYRNGADVPFFGSTTPLYQLQVAGAGVMLGNEYLTFGDWPPADRWSAPDRIPDDCYLIIANDPAAFDSHQFGLVPGSVDGPCASTRFPRAHLITRIINSWPTGTSRADFLARLRAAHVTGR